MRLINAALFITIILYGMSMMPASVNDNSGEITIAPSYAGMHLFAQEHQRADQPQKTEPADSTSALYQVMGVILIVWIGLALFLFKLDRTLARLEKDLNSKK